MAAIASQITSLTIRSFIQTKIKENIKAPRHWPLCGEFTGTGEFPTQMASNAKMFPFDDVIMRNFGLALCAVWNIEGYCLVI